MRPLVFLVFLEIVLGVNCAVAPSRHSRLSGNSHRRAVRAPKVNGTRNHKHHSAYFSNAIPGNYTQEFSAHRLHSSRMDYYQNLTSPVPVATHRPHGGQTKSHPFHKRNLHYEFNGTSKLEAPSHAETRSPSRVADTRSKQNNASAEFKNDATHTWRPRSLNLAPTPAPTGSRSSDTTVFINDENDFAMLLPQRSGGILSCHISFFFPAHMESHVRTDLGSGKRRRCLLHLRRMPTATRARIYSSR